MKEIVRLLYCCHNVNCRINKFPTFKLWVYDKNHKTGGKIGGHNITGAEVQAFLLKYLGGIYVV